MGSEENVRVPFYPREGAQKNKGIKKKNNAKRKVHNISVKIYKHFIFCLLNHKWCLCLWQLGRRQSI